MLHKDWRKHFHGNPATVPPLNIDFKIKIDTKLVDRMTAFLRKALEERTALGYERVIVGFSGGVDSTISGILAQKAFKDKCEAVIIEFDNSKGASIETEFSLKIAKKIGIPYRLINAQELFQAHQALLSKNSIVAKVHLRSRLAISILFQYADNNNALVIDTTDKSEDLLKLYEESFRGHLSPLRNLYRSEIHDLADFLKVPELKDKPAGCPDLTNSDALGVKTQEVDPILYLLVEKEIPPEQLAKKYGLDPLWLENLRRRVFEQPLRTERTIFKP